MSLPENTFCILTSLFIGAFSSFLYFKIRRIRRLKKLKAKRIVHFNMIHQTSLLHFDSTLIQNNEEINFLKNTYQLTNREEEMLNALVTGLSYQEIAQKFNLSEKTISKHASNIFQKTNCKNKKELIALVRSKKEKELSIVN